MFAIENIVETGAKVGKTGRQKAPRVLINPLFTFNESKLRIRFI